MSDKRTEERNEAFDSAMREKVAGYEPTVPHALWNRISAELNETEEVVAPSIPLYKEAAVTPRWNMAIAAAVIITIGAGSLLFSFNGNNGINSTPTAHNTVVNAAPAVRIPVSENKTVAEATLTVSKQAVVIAKNDKPAKNEVAISVKPESTTPDNTAVTAQSNDDSQLASMPATSQNNYIETGNVPVSALKRLSAPISLNDEITVIKPAPSKKKHHKHGAEEETTTKVIVIGKKYDSAPDIRYQVPVRF
ncbi:MAG: hypothetical protein JWO03_1376 [Bacteroidetes bacterium]|nr:hypothetical protein [Bacteroidota bacterium]